MARRGAGGNRGQGSKWCPHVKRLGIYLRDGLACVYCDKGVAEGKLLTLDHLVPRSTGGTNAPTNLVTACVQCNSARRARRWFTGLLPQRRALIDRLRRRVVQREWAREMIAERAA